MKQVFIFLIIAFTNKNLEAQSMFDKIKKAATGDGNTAVLNTNKAGNSGIALSNADIVNGLKEALRVATDTTAKTLGSAGGYLKNEAIKIVMPTEAIKVEKMLRSIGAGTLVDKAIFSMNAAAENAAGQVGAIFLTSIKQMSVTDGINILRGGDHAATDFLKKTTTVTLMEKMKPVIENSLKQLNAEKYWNDVFSKYNLFSQQKVETDLSNYVTSKALEGMFYNISLQESKIRKDPAAQVTDILKKVFGK